MSALPPSPTSSSSRSPSPNTVSPVLRKNPTDPNAKWLVQKFGGTSVGKFPAKIARDVVSPYIKDHRVAIVCSARSGSTKALGTTNLLLRAASEALMRRPQSPQMNSPSSSGTMTPLTFGLFGQIKDIPPRSPPHTPLRSRSSSADEKSGLCMTPLSPLTVPIAGQSEPKFNATVDLIREQHIKAANEAIHNPEIRNELEEEIERDCDWLRGFLFASQVVDEVSPRSKDSIIGLGEKLACKLMTAVLRDQGIDAEYVSLENIVPDVEQEIYSSVGGNVTLDQGFYDRVAAAVGERVRACGYFSPIPGSLLLQVGRGYTDLLSALLAVGLSTSDGATLLDTGTLKYNARVDWDVSELQIWKEVDGIFTADPRKVPTARVLEKISPDEAAELTYYGSEVVHPFTMEQVIRRKIPIRIKNVENPSGCGTLICPDSELSESPSPVSPVSKPFSTHSRTGSVSEQLSALALSGSESPRKLPTAVTIKEHIIVINVNSNRKSVSHGFLAGIFGVLDRYGVVVDLISTSEVHVSMAIEDTFVASGGGGSGGGGKTLDRVIRELRSSGTVSVHRNMAILSLVGKNMRHLVGIAGLMFTTLGKGNVNIEMISQGASEINISCVIDSQDAVKALNLIHQSCLRVPASYSANSTNRGESCGL
ncbi:hypothetical protein D9758_008990 [Tetrapyrgos nigripes]|uniref:aspartate kinase n=1 Tax=Tetrapyrgos nigripes TaxID=182062 RepID=A0A8H5GKE8_9AGAR|nr:hypothetical protein D9758_008990 [Tetrapyrgos nigripes]